MIIEKLMKVALLGSEWVLYLLLGLSVWSIATMVERFVYFYRVRGEAQTIRAAINETLPEASVADLAKRLDGKKSVQANVVRLALHWLGAGPEAVDDAVSSELSRLRSELERGSNLLGTLGNNAPFVGLFGTVLGVIIAFDALGGSGGNPGEMGGVMAGIAEALVATGVGLFVALPAVVAYNLVQRRVAEIETDVDSLIKLISAYAKSDPLVSRRAQELREQQANVAHLHVSERSEAARSGIKARKGQAV